MALAARYDFAGDMLGTLEEGESYVGGALAQVGGYFRGLVPYLFSGFTFFIHFVSVLVMGIYLALRPALYREGFIALAPPLHRELVRDILGDLGRTLKAWVVGQLLAMFVLGVLTWIGLEILRVDYALAFGVFSGAVAIVPFFGTLVSTLLPALFVLGRMGGAGHALLVALLGVVVHLIEANIVAPMIMERQVHLPPVLSILSVLDHGPPAASHRAAGGRAGAGHHHGRGAPRVRAPGAGGEGVPARHTGPSGGAEAARRRGRARAPRGLRAHRSGPSRRLSRAAVSVRNRSSQVAPP